MRIHRLDLVRYGAFTDHCIDFGDRPPEGPDLHIIYGPNEAGKSTTLAAYLDLLFGIETRSRYGFLHPYQTMRIGGELEINGAARQFTRIKRPQNSLLDSAGKPIPDGAILTDLGGIDRAAYSTMFSLDDETLEAGGENILASKGELGSLLFAASAGLSDLSHKLGDFKAEADRFYKFHARGGDLSELKTRLDDLKAKREQIDTVAPEYARLVESSELAKAQYEEALSQRAIVSSRLADLHRQVAALPRLAALRTLRGRIEPLAEIPDAPTGWTAQLPRLQTEEVELATKARTADFEIASLADELSAISVDDLALSVAARVDATSAMRARYETAEKDIPERRLAQRDADIAIAGILTKLECKPGTDPSSLLLEASKTGALRDLMQQRSGVIAKLALAEDELTTAQSRLADAKSNLAAAGGETEPEASTAQGRLAQTLALARGADYAARRRLAERTRQQHLDALADHLGALRPWTGEAQALRNLAVPDELDIGRWRTSLAETEGHIKTHDAEIERLLDEQRKQTAALDAARDVTGVLNDQRAAEIRTAREEAWASHKRALDAASASAFEERLRHDDIITNTRIANAAEVAQLNQIGKTLALINAELADRREKRDTAAKQLAFARSEIADHIQEIAPSAPPDWSLPKLETWLARRDKALESLAAADRAGRDKREAKQDGEETLGKLIDAAKAAGINFAPNVDAETLMSLIQASIDKQAKLAALRSDVADRERDLKMRERQAEDAQAADQTWKQNWIALCRSCWLGQDGAIPTVATVGEVLKALAELGPLIEKRAGFVDRIQKMESDQRQFATEVEALAKALNLDAAPTSELAAKVAEAVQKARAAESARKGAEKRLREAQARKTEIEKEAEAHGRRRLEMTAYFKVDSLAEVDAKLHELDKRQELQTQAATAEQDIRDAVEAPTIAAAEEILDKLDRAAIQLEIAQLEGRFEDLDKRSRDLFTEHSKASDRLMAVGGDDAVAKIEEQRQTLNLAIEEGAKRYLCLKLGVTAAEHALRIYRDKHRSSMMARASEAFRIISRDGYRGLATQPNKDSEILVALNAKEGSKVASELSKGTRFQLYLALRVAGYQEYAQSRASVPFIADDIMETFDDFRAEEAFRLFAGMAAVGQVIYLTHHRHLCDIARNACPSVRVHNLPSRTPQDG